jgi:HEAT repeat protein
MDFDEYLDELRNGSVRLKVTALPRLSDLDDKQAGKLASTWPEIDVRRRRRVIQELIDLAEDNVDLNFDAVFFRGLEDDDASVRLEAVRGLWEYEGVNLIAPLLQALEHDKDAQVRAEAALSLGRYVLLSEYGRLRERSFKDIEAGLKCTLGRAEEVEEVRARALESIGAHNASWVRQAIREAYESGRRRLKVSAVHAMGRSCEPRWLPLLLHELSSDEAEVRYEAAIACGSLADQKAVPHLVRLLEDPDEEVRQVAVAALGEIGGSQAKNALMDAASSEKPALREAALAALSEIDFDEDPLSFRFRL